MITLYKCHTFYYKYHWSPYVNIDYNQHGQTSQHGGNKYSSLDLSEMVHNHCHPPTTFRVA